MNKLKFSVIKAPDQRLRVKTIKVKKINNNHLDNLKEMIKLTKTFLDPEGVGLATTQVGLNEQYFIAKLDKGTFTEVFNPEILEYSKKTKVYMEGCLSIPDYWGETERSLWVKVRYMDKNGQIIEKKLTGIDAWIFQHEYDHLQGKLFMDKVLEQKGKIYKVIGKDRTGNDIFQEVKVS